MINWLSLAFNSLWILGLALALAAFSYASWQASLRKEKLGYRLRQPNIQNWLNIAFALFCFGLAGTSKTWWEIVLWFLLGLLFIGQVVSTRFKR